MRNVHEVMQTTPPFVAHVARVASAVADATFYVNDECEGFVDEFESKPANHAHARELGSGCGAFVVACVTVGRLCFGDS